MGREQAKELGDAQWTILILSFLTCKTGNMKRDLGRKIG